MRKLDEKTISFPVAGREITLVGDEAADIRFLQPVGKTDVSSLIAEYSCVKKENPALSRCIVAVPVENWNDDLSPWAAGAVFGDRSFGSGAGITLSYLTDTLIPELSRLFPAENPKYCIAGYSLAGLFALWASYETDAFVGAAGVSPSVWFPDFEAYTQSRENKSRAVYLSLGRREEKTRNAVMKTVGDKIRVLHARLDGQIPCVLEWNDGGHFADSGERLSKGLVWLERNMTDD